MLTCFKDLDCWKMEPTFLKSLSNKETHEWQERLHGYIFWNLYFNSFRNYKTGNMVASVTREHWSHQVGSIHQKTHYFQSTGFCRGNSGNLPSRKLVSQTQNVGWLATKGGRFWMAQKTTSRQQQATIRWWYHVQVIQTFRTPPPAHPGAGPYGTPSPFPYGLYKAALMLEESAHTIVVPVLVRLQQATFLAVADACPWNHRSPTA